MCKIFHRKHKNVSIIYIIPPYWHDTNSWNSSSCKTRTYLFYIVNVMDADALVIQGAKASATMILVMLNQINSVPAHSGLIFLIFWNRCYAINLLCIMFIFGRRPGGDTWQHLLNSWSCRIASLTLSISLIFHKCLSSSAAETLVKYQSEWTILNTNLMASRPYKILYFSVYLMFPCLFQLHKWWAPVRDLLPYWPEWIIVFLLIAIHLAVTFALPLPDGCPTYVNT